MTISLPKPRTAFTAATRSNSPPWYVDALGMLTPIMKLLFGLMVITTMSCQPARPATTCSQVAIVGDSLTVEGSGELHDLLPDAIINARGGRTTAQAVEAAKGIEESNDVDCWVFAIGTNDLFFDVPTDVSRQAVADLLAIADIDRVVWVLVEYGQGIYAQQSPERFNALIPASVISVTPGVAAAESVDGVHLSEEGYEARAAAIVAALP